MARSISRPSLHVLAGVNGAGKSSLMGALLKERLVTWYNPDDYSRALVADGMSKEEADGQAWAFGRRRLEQAILEKSAFAFETTLGGNTIAELVARAADTHDVTMTFIGLDSVEKHLARVAYRVARGGHDIPESRIRERWLTARNNLITLLPKLRHLQVFDNSRDAGTGENIPDPLLVLEIVRGDVKTPGDAQAMARVPQWAKSIVAAALKDGKARRTKR